MARSKRLRQCEITREDEVQLNSNEPSPVSQTQHILEHDADASSNSDSDSASENKPQVQEQVDHEYNDTLEIEDDQGYTTNKQGMIRAKDVWNLPNGQRIVIKCNKFGQPVQKGGGILGGWLGTLSRKENFRSLSYNSWKKVPNTVKTELIQLTRTKFKLPMDNNVNAWILKSVSRKWKDYKCELKAKYMIEDYTKQQIVNVVPKEIVPQQWVDLVHYWFSEKSQLYSRIRRASRAKHTTPHITGSMSFARKRQEFEEINQREPGCIEFFAVNHKSKDGSYINTTASDFVSDAMVKVNANITSGSLASAVELENDAFIGIKGKDRYGRVRGYGIGVVPTQVSGPQAYLGSVRYDDNTEEVQRLKSKIQLMQDSYESKLVGMQKDYESKLDMIHQNYESRMSGMQYQLNEVTSILLNFVRPSDILGAEQRGRTST
ncbi:uncharacterized protein LOC109716850 [Ananas comosus]|uniref:Uncharacterized protein LOC109716850 n=1 Tax=Ananas comosus TaxID=4615 RepID=A0A6P5FQT8_ANACO|nr:uncharacterized protein LOC109716850 [Ananas comosus]XP_020098043.1 uncharacterized protein LOC109716850 [Ananas comosus]XP_020098044.1 uncharacterized protein LOC109716850 [Ananas comosus]